MAPSSLQKKRAFKASFKSIYIHIKKIVALAAAFSASAAALAYLPYLDKILQHNSILTGYA